MSPAAKFHATIATSTIFIMFWTIGLVVPELERHLDFTISGRPILSSVAALVSSSGVYGLLAKALEWLLKKSILIRSWIFGPEFMHGTWIGYFIGRGGQKRYMVDRFEQDLDGLVITGRSFTADGQPHAQWEMDSATIDARRGKIVYTYNLAIISRGERTQGVGDFQFERSSQYKAPKGLIGYVVDVADGKRIPAHEIKVDSSLLNFDAALAKAREHFYNVDVREDPAATSRT